MFVSEPVSSVGWPFEPENTFPRERTHDSGSVDQIGRAEIPERIDACLRKSRLRLKMPNPPTAYILLIEVNNETDPPDYR